MSDDKTPDPLSDVAKGLGLLFRAARTAARKIPTKDLEEVVLTSAREVGRAIENVAATIEREVSAKVRGDRPAAGRRSTDDAERDRSADPSKRNPPE
ncbi:MAG TPA: hypothetical protein VEK07_23090 [Polyangiaceae bacterium]|nr:hypothetical protein [Polyangiaceae bacterium]